MSDLDEQFSPKHLVRFQSTAGVVKEAEDVKQLLLPESGRGVVPYTRADFVVREDPRRVEWERETRKFLSKLPENFAHKVTAAMVYEWATGVNLSTLAAAEGVDPDAWRGGAQWGSANVHLRHINWVLREYFGKPYKTTILGRHVGRAYTVRASFKVHLKKPENLTLLPEWKEGTLNP